MLFPELPGSQGKKKGGETMTLRLFVAPASVGREAGPSGPVFWSWWDPVGHLVGETRAV